MENINKLHKKSISKIYYPYIDIIKIISCLGIVCIHTKPFEGTCFNETFIKICPTFVSIFFLLSSILLWKKITWDNKDSKILQRYISRLLIMYCVWSIILSPFWVHALWENVQNDIWWVLPLKFIFYGGCPGSWFIISMIYGTLIVYFANKYINKHIVFIIILLIFLYYGYVYWGGYDYLNIYWKGTNWFPSPFYASTRSVFWIECSLYLPYFINSKFLNQNQSTYLLIASILIWIFLTLNTLGKWQYIANAFIAIITTLYCIKRPQNTSENLILATLRNYTIIIYFAHFFYQWIFYHFIGLGFDNFICSLSCSCITAITITKLSKRYKILKYTY